MNRVRLSTTVNAERLARARQLVAQPDSVLIDRALAALVTIAETERELAALAAQPYDDDPDLAWTPESGPALPYYGEVPAEVLTLADARRKRRR